MRKIFFGTPKAKREVKERIYEALIPLKSRPSEVWVTCCNDWSQNNALRLQLWRAKENESEKELLFVWTEEKGKHRKQIKMAGTVNLVTDKSGCLLFMMEINEKTICYQEKRYAAWRRTDFATVADLWRRDTPDRGLQGRVETGT